MSGIDYTGEKEKRRNSSTHILRLNQISIVGCRFPCVEQQQSHNNTSIMSANEAFFGHECIDFMLFIS